MTALFNIIVPALKHKLRGKTIPSEELIEAIKQHKGEGYSLMFDCELRDDYDDYNGECVPAMGWFPFDFDAKDLEDARRDLLKLYEGLSLTPDIARIYFSGNRGFHLYVRHELFMCNGIQGWRHLCQHLATKFDLKTLDLSIIKANGKFRIPGSKHQTSGLYKIELSHHQMQVMPIEEIKALATTPNFISLDVYAVPNVPYPFFFPLGEQTIGSVVSPVSTAVSVINENTFGTENAIESDTQYQYIERPCTSKIWGLTGLEEGRRHGFALVLIYECYIAGLSEDECKDKMAPWLDANNLTPSRVKDYLARVIPEHYAEASVSDEKKSYGCKSLEKFAHCTATCKIYNKATCNPSPVETPETLAILEKKVAVEEKKEVAEKEQEEARATCFVRGLPDWRSKKPLCTIENIRHMMNKLGIHANYDVIKKDIKIFIPKSKYLIDTEKNDKLSRITSYAIKCGMPHGQVADFVSFVASQNPVNPVAQWIESTPWDGTSRLQEFFGTVVSKEDHLPEKKALKETLMKRWMLSAVAAAFLPSGVSAHGVLVFAGDQYIGKTNWFKNLVPAELDVTRDGMLLDIKDKDSVYQIVSNWLVELGEVDATFRKSDIAQLKAFITRSIDTIRLPYRREPGSFARRTVFFASVNDSNYLADPTGNRRFWTIDCESINHKHGLNMQQVWAEFHSMFKAGEGWYLNHQDMLELNKHNQEHENESSFEEKMREIFAFDGELSFYTATNIAESLGYQKPTTGDLKRIAAAVRKISGQLAKKNNGRKGYWMRIAANIPPPVANDNNSHVKY